MRLTLVESKMTQVECGQISDGSFGDRVAKIRAELEGKLPGYGSMLTLNEREEYVVEGSHQARMWTQAKDPYDLNTYNTIADWINHIKTFPEAPPTESVILAMKPVHAVPLCLEFTGRLLNLHLRINDVNMGIAGPDRQVPPISLDEIEEHVKIAIRRLGVLHVLGATDSIPEWERIGTAQLAAVNHLRGIVGATDSCATD